MSQARSRTLKALRLAALAAIGATALAVTPAWANPISSWTFSVTSTFDTHNTHFSQGTSCTRNSGTEYHNHKGTTSISWGCPVGKKQSSLVINPNTGSGTAYTDGSAEDLGVTLTHNNFVINQGHLTKTNLINMITLTPAGGSAMEPFALTFGINFTETNNNYPCSGTPVVPSNNPCPDIFVLDNDSLNNEFIVGDYKYYASIYPASGVGGLDKAECHAAHVKADSCTGFITQEKTSNELDFNLRITSTKIPGGPGLPVPEPGALGMMGFGLLSIVGLLFLRRRRTAEDKVD